MSIQSEINRIKGNIEDTLDVVASTGVTVPEGSNSDDLPGLVQSLADEKQDKDTALTTSGGTLNNGSSLKSQADDSGDKASIMFSTNTVDIKTDSGDMAGIRVSGQTFLGETTSTVNIRGKKVTIGGELYNFASNDVIEVTEETPADAESGTAPVYSTKIKNLVDPTDPKDAVPKGYLDENFMSSPTGGTTGQVLTKTADGVEWNDAPSGLPDGGTEGQMLYKSAKGAEWKDKPASSDIAFTTTSDLTSKNVQAAIEEVKSKIPSNYVPSTRTINDKALSENVTLEASDVGALPAQTGTQGQYLGFTADNVVGPVDKPVMWVTITGSTADKTGTQIKEAYNAGYSIFAKSTDESGNISIHGLVQFRGDTAHFGGIDINTDGNGVRGITIDASGAVNTAASFLAAPYIYFEESEGLVAANVQDAIEEVQSNIDQKIEPIETKIEKYEPTQIIIASVSEIPSVVNGAILITYEE